MNPAFWSGKRVLLTGHTGFKGAWLALWLERLGARVSGYALDPPTEPSLFALAGLEGSLDHQRGDLRDESAVAEAVRRVRPDVVFHLAAQALVRLSYERPVETYAVNVQGTVHLLEALRRAPGARVAVVVTSDKCYENRPGAGSYREGDPLGGHDPYSSSKAAAELVTSAYRDSFFHQGPLALASVRAGNVIGGGDWARDRLVPDLLQALQAGRAPQLRNPEAVRPWQHVLEPLSGYLRLAERLWDEPGLAGPWNFGPLADDEQPVRHLVERLQAGWGGGPFWRPQPGEHPREAQVLRLDSSRARESLGWRSRWSLDRSLASIVDWHRGLEAGRSVRILCLEQIQAYEAS